jgi:integrase
MLAKLRALGIPKAIAETFPLTPHDATGRWCKKLPTPYGPKVFYFGRMDDWPGALGRYALEKNDLVAGRTPTTRNTDGLRLRDLLNEFLHFKRGRIATGELTMRSWYDYHQTGERLMKVLGENRIVETLGPDDFERLRSDYAKTWQAVRIGNEINRARVVFRWAFDQKKIPLPVAFGAGFKRPTRRTLRKVRARDRQLHGARMFTPEELRTIIDAAPQPLKAMVHLGINGGMHNMDVATLPIEALDLERGFVDFPRGKTGIPRRIPLWPETVASIREWLQARPQPKSADDAHLLFLTKQRRPWYRLGRFVEEEERTVVKGIDNPVSKSFRVLLDNLGISGKRNFLALRHGFRTVGRGARDREAVDAIMGHADESMAGHYLEDGLPDDRLQAVTEYVRRWLFAKPAKADGNAPALKIADDGDNHAAASA